VTFQLVALLALMQIALLFFHHHHHARSPNFQLLSTIQASERRLELLSKSEVVWCGEAKKLRVSFHFGGHYGGQRRGGYYNIIGRKQRRQRTSVAGLVGRGVLGGSPAHILGELLFSPL
jgi:hypothetical protein